MVTIVVVSPGAMGSAVGAAYAAGGVRVAATVAGGRARTAALARAAGVELLLDLGGVVAASDLVLSATTSLSRRRTTPFRPPAPAGGPATTWSAPGARRTPA